MSSVQYAVHLYGYLKEWRKNPYWSFSCCLGFVLPLIALPGEISGLTGTNVLDTQLDTGQMEMTTITDAVKDSGVVDITLEETEQHDNTPAVEQDDNCNGDQYNIEKCDQGEQTELSSNFFIADVNSDDPVKDARM